MPRASLSTNQRHRVINKSDCGRLHPGVSQTVLLICSPMQINELKPQLINPPKKAGSPNCLRHSPQGSHPCSWSLFPSAGAGILQPQTGSPLWDSAPLLPPCQTQEQCLNRAIVTGHYYRFTQARSLSAPNSAATNPWQQLLHSLAMLATSRTCLHRPKTTVSKKRKKEKSSLLEKKYSRSIPRRGIPRRGEGECLF